MSLSGQDIPVKVAIRCRPISAKERRDACQVCVEFVDDQPQLILGGNYPFTYDYVFPPHVAQEQIYEDCIKPLIGNVFKGFNATILAYGQTGSGKTYTMGTAFSTSSADDDESLGVIPRAITEIFEEIIERNADKFDVRVSFLEIYKEDVLDLLSRSGRKEEVAIREDRDGVKVTGLYEIPIASTKQALQCLEQGSVARTTGATAMNETSSRSHAIFTVILQKNSVTETMTSKLHFVDLAGSERVKKTKASGNRFKEGVNINLGLLSLGNVISALSEGKNSHVPYREAKLTRLLQDSLGGNSHTVMVACISPADFNLEETLNTLRYAQRARKIKNKPIVNRDPHAAEVARLKQLVQQLQMQVLQQNGSKESSIAESVAAIEVKALKMENLKLKEDNEKLTSELQNAIDQTTDLYEKAFMAEMTRDKMKVRLEELRIKTGIMAESFNMSVNLTNDVSRKEHMVMFHDLKEKILELQSDHQIAEENLSKCNLESSTDSDCIHANGEPERNDDEGMDTDANVTSEVTLRQVKMNRELQEINKLLAKKEELAGRMIISDEKITAMKQNYEVMMQGLESEVTTLQKEKEELNQALRAVKVNAACTKISEQRRKRLQELESQIGELRRKIVEYSKMAKMKEQSDQKVTKLNDEIRELKQARVRLVRQMRSEAERLRAWKLQKEKEVCKLRQQDRRRQVEFVKKEQQFSKRQNAMRIKMEEAMSVNKRLKDALQVKKLSADQRKQERERTAMLKSRNATGMDVVKQRIVEWITQEFDLVVSAREARYHLDSLLNDRGLISAQLNELRGKIEDSSSSDRGSSGSSKMASNIEEKIRELTNDLELRNIQISDLQQKLLDVDQDEKLGTKFDSLQTMNEAKCALRWLFDTAVLNKVELALKNSHIQEKMGDYEEAVRTIETTQAQLNEMARNYEEQMHVLKEEQEEKVLFLLARLPKTPEVTTGEDTTSVSDEELLKRLKFQEAEIQELNNVRDELTKSKHLIKKLETDILEIKTKRTNSQKFSPFSESPESVVSEASVTRKRASSIMAKVRPEVLPKQSTVTDYINSPTTDNDEVDDTERDPDWHMTPLMIRIRNMRKPAYMNIKIDYNTDDDEVDDDGHCEPSKPKQKRPSDPRCACSGNCSTKKCGCRKGGRVCNENCGCEACKNRGDSSYATAQSSLTNSNSASTIHL